MSRIRTIKGLALASGIICLLVALGCANYASTAWFNVRFYQILAQWDPWYQSLYLIVLQRFSLLVFIGVAGCISGIIVLATRTSVQNNLRSIGALWIVFGIISLPAIGGLFALIAGILALAEHGETGGIARTHLHQARQPGRSPTSPHVRRVVCRSCNAMGDTEDRFCAICGAPMKG